MHARGVPYMAHLLGLLSVKVARANGHETVELGDLFAAIQQAVAEADRQTAQLYDQLTSYGEDMEMRHLLQQVAAGPQDRFGAFTVEMIDGHLYVASFEANPACWERLHATGCVRAEAGNRFSFTDSLLRCYILLRNES